MGHIEVKIKNLLLPILCLTVITNVYGFGIDDIKNKYQYAFIKVHRDGTVFTIKKKDLQQQPVTTQRKRVPQSQGRKSISQAINPLNTVTRSGLERDVKQALLKKYKNNYITVKLLLDANLKAFDSLKQRTITTVGQQVLTRLINKYYPHMVTVELLYNAEIKAYSSMQ